jgi:hypothetical protein
VLIYIGLETVLIILGLYIDGHRKNKKLNKTKISRFNNKQFLISKSSIEIISLNLELLIFDSKNSPLHIDKICYIRIIIICSQIHD